MNSLEENLSSQEIGGISQTAQEDPGKASSEQACIVAGAQGDVPGTDEEELPAEIVEMFVIVLCRRES